MQNVFKTSVILVLSLFLQWTANAQNNTVSGAITDQASGETLIGAAITVAELPGKGAASNEYGFYRCEECRE